jgi:hypothetical protein
VINELPNVVGVPAEFSVGKWGNMAGFWGRMDEKKNLNCSLNHPQPRMK